MSTPARRNRGLTLVELMVVLVILVILAGVALTSTEGLVDQAHFDASRRGLEGLEGAILGVSDLRLPDKQPWTTGFVADVGRLPKALGVDPATQLAELWEPPAGVPLSSVQTPAGDPEVRLPAGWRGPYLRLPLGSARLLDGWGKTYVLQAAASPDAATPAVAGDPVAVVRCLGADGKVGGAGYDQDLALVVHKSAAPLAAPRHLSDLPVRVSASSAPGAGANVVVRVYGPIEGTAATLRQWVFPSATGTATRTFLGVPLGPRAIRAYQTNEDPTATPQAPLGTWTHRTDVVAVSVTAGALPELSLVPR